VIKRIQKEKSVKQKKRKKEKKKKKTDFVEFGYKLKGKSLTLLVYFVIHIN
jgi:hypothetical protein